jgi:pyridinium-3,5-bisthiocarboxylic acid mononucleotide nickel chelatase
VSVVGWLDATAGVSGDMLLGACVAAGVELAVLQRAVDGLHLPERVTLEAVPVQRCGLAATSVRVSVGDDAARPRRLGDLLRLLDAAELGGDVRDRAAAVFRALAAAEGRVHGIPEHEVHFHEVGALDSLADVVGAVAGLHALGLDRLVCSPIALGGGRIRAAHGLLPLPGPAVLELLRAAAAPGTGGPLDVELATPTGVAVAVTLARSFGPMPGLRPSAIGVGAGSRDLPGHPNVTRLVVGEATDPSRHDDIRVVVEANVDDLDPRLWPPTLAALLAAGADDAWLTPILMKKGRPAHTVSVLVEQVQVDAVERILFTHTTTIGARRYVTGRTTLPRTSVVVTVAGEPVRIKIATLDGEVVNAEPEYEDVLAAAAATGRSARSVMDAARAAYAADPGRSGPTA